MRTVGTELLADLQVLVHHITAFTPGASPAISPRPKAKSLHRFCPRNPRELHLQLSILSDLDPQNPHLSASEAHDPGSAVVVAKSMQAYATLACGYDTVAFVHNRRSWEQPPPNESQTCQNQDPRLDPECRATLRPQNLENPVVLMPSISPGEPSRRA